MAHTIVLVRPRGSPDELEKRRQLAVQRVVEEGYSPDDIAEALGVDVSSVHRWVATLGRYGPPGLLSRPASGRPPKLTGTQEKIVSRWLYENPRAFGFRSELWTARRVALLIEREFHVHFNAKYLATWLRERSFTPQKPQRLARERDTSAIAAWIDRDWPRIKREAARQHAAIALIDESGLLMAPLVRRSWAPKGQPPTLRQPARHRAKVCIAAALVLAPRRDRLKLFFKTLINEYFNSFYIAAFLEALLMDVRSQIVVLWDGGPNHRGDPIRALQESPCGHRLRFERLPPYAPTLNPVEQLWSWLKFGRFCNFVADDVWDLDRATIAELMSIQDDQKLLWGIFAASDLPVPGALLT